ncbi:MAG TPA: MBOAT family O-acyltransferase [Polyangiaceae bacterium]|nr:MBOAT family O-acyltransferase [Polyangiaceae bacterium]
MLFNTGRFALFFLIVFLANWLLGKRFRAQNVVLVLASQWFYACWDYRFLALLWFSMLVDYVVAMRLDASSNERQRKWLITLSVSVQLGILGLFKYLNFFADSGAALLQRLGFGVHPIALGIVLPVGISFYTFQTMSYTIDVYRRVIPAERNLLSFATFVSLFPQLVAGPIERARRILPQINAPRSLPPEALYSGATLILFGLYKKVFIADNLATVVDRAFSEPEALTRPEAILALYAFAFQIYGDFSGYTDIARGTARLLGFDFALNFRRPYFARNPSDFWQRWHISLSSWLRDYLYIPLGGNKRGTGRTLLNLFLTMLLGGLWHGASWTFVLWGAYHGLLLVVHRLLKPVLNRVQPKNVVASGLWAALRCVVMFHLVALGWLPFRAHKLLEVKQVLLGILQRGGSFAEAAGSAKWLCACAGLLLLLELAEELKPDFLARRQFWARGLVYAAVLLSILIAGAPGGQTFIYFQF